jgi:tetratricopeptide (TPR) repeat protein
MHNIEETAMNINERNIVSEITCDIKSDKMAFMFGAGISLYRRSCCPSWLEMVKAVLTEIAELSPPEELSPILQPHFGLLFNEVFFQITDQVLPREKTASLIQACLWTREFSNIHRFIAWLIENFNVSVLTTNFDELIEAAGFSLGRSDRLIKLHGTLSDIDSARFTVNSVFQPLSQDIAEKARTLIRDRTLLIAGYSGMDEFDVMPVLFNPVDGPNRIIWVQHPGDSINNSVTRHFSQVRTCVITADIDVILSKVYSRISHTQLSDANLDTWQKTPEICEDSDSVWWKKKLRIWVDDLRRTDKTKLNYLWARFADHLRLYNVKVNGLPRNLVAEAYESILKNNSFDRKTTLETRSRVAYMKRTIGNESSAVQELEKVISDTRDAISNSQLESESNVMKNLLGWMIHQQAVAYQNLKQFKSAKDKFEEAITLRESINDMELPYSVFGHFMNAYRAKKNDEGPIDDFAQNNWRDWLAEKLDRFTVSFKEKYEIEHYALTKHNAAFVYQYMAEELEYVNELPQAMNCLHYALERYESAMDYRQRLRDPRMIAQSGTRVAQCKVSMARIHLKGGGSATQEHIQMLLDNSENLARDVEQIYRNIPQEDFRYDDVQRILEEIAQLRDQRHNNSLQ